MCATYKFHKDFKHKQLFLFVFVYLSLLSLSIIIYLTYHPKEVLAHWNYRYPVLCLHSCLI